MNTHIIIRWHNKRRALGVINWHTMEIIGLSMFVTALALVNVPASVMLTLSVLFIYRGSRAKFTKRQLSYALSHGLVTPFYQARIDKDGVSISGCEALARIQKREGTGLYTPADFLGIALASGLVPKLDLEILKVSLSDLQHWRKTNLVEDSFTLSFNVDRLTLINKEAVHGIIELILLSKLPPQMIEMEITEHSLEDSRSKDLLMSNVKEIKDRTGIKLAIDDFAIGHSSAISLISLPVDSIKIDKAFATMTNEKSMQFLAFLSNFATKIGCKVIFEGIETAEQHTLFASLNIAEYQGYFFHRPSGAKEFTQYLANSVS